MAPRRGIGQPGVYRPHRNLDGKGRQKRDEKPYLHVQGNRRVIPGKDIETVRLDREVQDTDQHRQRPEEGIQAKRERCINTPFTTPYADYDEHWDQGRLEENVKQKPVKRREHTDHQAGQDQESPHVLRDLFLDDVPSSNDANPASA